jgi:SAM-dependent methyltransferase
MSDDVTFTGERLHAGDQLFKVDLARHEAAYKIAAARLRGGRVLDLGCGSGYGAAALAALHTPLIGLDRIRPDAANRGATAFVRADLHGIPLRAESFDLIVSFQVIEHLEDPTPYLEAISKLLAPGGTALITTPNIEMSDGVNPYHVHEYRADELSATLRPYFSDVVIQGIGATEPVHAYFAARSARIRRIMRIDPLGLRNALPRPLLEWLFARFALLVRRNTARDDGAPDATWRDFPVGPADSRCLDLLAICTKR